MLYYAADISFELFITSDYLYLSNFNEKEWVPKKTWFCIFFEGYLLWWANELTSRVRREVVIVIEVFENQWVIVSAIVPLVIERGR